MSLTRTIRRPDPSEYDEFYASYVSRAPDGDLPQVLERAMHEELELYRSIPESRATFRYAPGKWSLAEVIGHVADAERTFSYRAMCIARGLGATPPRTRPKGVGRRSNRSASTCRPSALKRAPIA